MMAKGSSYAHITAIIVLALIVPNAMAAEREERTTVGPGPLQRSIQAQHWTLDMQPALSFGQGPPIHVRSSSPRVRASRKLMFGLIGVVAGAYAGYGAGNWSDGADHYERIITIPVGAVGGGILGVWIASR